MYEHRSMSCLPPINRLCEIMYHVTEIRLMWHMDKYVPSDLTVWTFISLPLSLQWLPNYNNRPQVYRYVSSLIQIIPIPKSTNLCSYSLMLHVKQIPNIHYWFGLWCLMPLSTIFLLYRGGLFYWWSKPKYLEKTRDLS